MEFLKGKLLVLFLFVSPFLAFIITLAFVSFLAPKMSPNDPAKVKMASLVQDHFAGRTHDHIYVFNDHVYMAKNKIEKGEIISTKDVEEGDFKLNSPHRGLILSDEKVLGSRAIHSIQPGRLLISADFEPSKAAKKAFESQNSGQLDNGSMLTLAGICGFALAPFLILIVAYIWILRIAFQTSMADGFSCLILSPFAIPMFAVQNWDRTRRPFQLFLLSWAFFGLIGGMMISGKSNEQALSLTAACQFGEAEARLEMKSPVLYTLKNLAAGQLISADAVTTREIQVDRVPQDAITKSSAAIGKKVKYGMTPNQIVSVHDLQ